MTQGISEAFQYPQLSCYDALPNSRNEMKRRNFITLFGGTVAAWPLGARAQPVTMPVVGFVYSAAGGPYAERLVAFRQGLAEIGFIDGRNVVIEYRFAEGRYERLPTLLSELVRHPVAVIGASGITAARAAKAATATIPIVFNTGGDPVRLGLVASLNRPESNLTGVVTFGKVLVAKQLELLHELVPKATTVAFLVNPSNAAVQEEIADARAAAGALGQSLLVVEARSERDIEAAFAAITQKRAGALLMQTDPFLESMRGRLVGLAAQHAVVAVSPYLDYAAAGGLLSYGSSITDALRLVGNYAGRILKGEKPADLPVQQAVKVEMIVNLKTAKALGLTMLTAILLRADHVIE